VTAEGGEHLVLLWLRDIEYGGASMVRLLEPWWMLGMSTVS